VTAAPVTVLLISEVTERYASVPINGMTRRRLWQILLPPAAQYSIEERRLRETFEVFLPHFAVR
jgi:hypothetical protein